MSRATPDFAKLKSGLKASWIAGDFGQIANLTAAEAEKFVKRLGIPSGARLLDVALWHRKHRNSRITAKRSVEFFRRYFGPTQTAFLRPDEAGQTALAAQLESLRTEYNTATDGTTSVEAKYLDVRATRAGSMI
jgi:hypothetical protein